MTRDRVWSTTAGVAGATHVVLVHGSLDRSAGMSKLSRRLERQLLVSRYDRRGYGRSLPHAGPFAMEHQVADLLQVIGEAGAGAPSVVVGHSYGGNVGLAAAERHPDLIAGVIVYESPLSWLDWWPGTTAGGEARAWSHDPADAAERFMRRLVGDERWDGLPPATREARRREGAALVAELTDLGEHPPWDPLRISVPVLPVRGEGAKPHHRRGMEVLAGWFGTEVVVLGGARHFGPNTHPDEFAAIVTEFVARCA